MEEKSRILNSMLELKNEENYIVLVKDGSYTGGMFNIINNEAVYNGDEFTSIFPQIFRSGLCGEKGIHVYKIKNNKLVDYKHIPANNINILHGNEIGYVVLYRLYNIKPLNEQDDKNLKLNLQIENIFNKDNDNIGKTDLYLNGINIEIYVDKDIFESKKHVCEDFKTLENAGIENVIKNNFLPWLKGETFKDRDNEKIYNGLKIVSITYDYHRIADEYSPTKQTDYFGSFKFEFISSSEYTKDILEAVEMEVLINNGKIVDVVGYDI